MEGFLDAYDPILSVTPAGIFINRVEVRILILSGKLCYYIHDTSVLYICNVVSICAPHEVSCA